MLKYLNNFLGKFYCGVITKTIEFYSHHCKDLNSCYITKTEI